MLPSVPDATNRRDFPTYISWASPLAAAIPIPVCLKDVPRSFWGAKPALGRGEIITPLVPEGEHHLKHGIVAFFSKKIKNRAEPSRKIVNGNDLNEASCHQEGP